MANTVTLTCLLEEYRGHDGAERLVARRGDEIEVSADKAEQLLADFPEGFKAPAKAAAKPKTAPKAKAPAKAGGTS